jgi:hypothetical protein
VNETEALLTGTLVVVCVLCAFSLLIVTLVSEHRARMKRLEIERLKIEKGVEE